MSFMKILSLISVLSVSSFADRWVTPATIKMVRVQSSGLAFFRINETSLSTNYYRFDATTTAGKAILADLLTAKSSQQQIQFYETSLVSGTSNQYNFDNFTLGID